MVDLPTNVAPFPREADLPFEEVYRRHAAHIYRFCVSQLRQPAAAEDATADVFVAALRAYEHARPSEGTRFWLLRIARNVLVDYHRREIRRQRLLQLVGRARQQTEEVHGTVALREEVRRVAAATAALRERDRLFIGLRVAMQMSYQEIGDFLDISEDAAKMGTHRALKALRARLGERS